MHVQNTIKGRTRPPLAVLLGVALSVIFMMCEAWSKGKSPDPRDIFKLDTTYDYPAMPQPSNFATRCARPGVIFCDPMDSKPVIIRGQEVGKRVPCRTLEDAISSKCGYRSWRWVRGGEGSPVVDQDIFAEGDGSLRLTFASNSSASGGGFYNSNFSPSLQETFGEGESFFVQFRVRFSCDRIWLNCDERRSGYKTKRRSFKHKKDRNTAFKIAIIEVGDVPGAKFPSNHCELTQVVLNHSVGHSWHAFHSCGWYAGMGKALGYKPLGSRQLDGQPVISKYRTWPVRSLADADRSEQCLRMIPDPWRRRKWGDSDPNCARIESDTWYTVTQQIVPYWQPKRKGVPRSLYRLWIQTHGQPAQLVIENNFYNRGPESAEKAYGKIILLPHSTGKDPGETHPDGYIWYDSIIVSGEMIAPSL